MSETNMDLRETHIIGRNTREWILHGKQYSALIRHHIALAGLSDAVAPYRMARVAPPHLHLLIVMEGEGLVWMGGHWEPCGAGRAYLSPPRCPMAFHPAGKHHWKFAWAYYTEPAASRYLDTPGCLLRDADPVPFECAIRGLQREIQCYGDESVAVSWAGLLHVACLRLLAPDAAGRRLQPLWQEVEWHPAYPWSIKNLAAKAGVSQEHLRRISLQETGRSPMQHVTFLRMQKAVILLQATQLKVEAIAEAVGYENPFAFSTAFKRHMGSSPSAYRGAEYVL